MPPADTQRQKIAAALKARAQAITVAAGFNTDAGLHVTHGYRRPALGDALPRVAMITAGEVPAVESQDDVLVRNPWPIAFVATAEVAADDEDALDTAEQLLADLKRAIFLPDRTLGGLLSANQEIGDIKVGAEDTADREPGGTFVEAGVVALVSFLESYGAPEVG
jgi:hypothetical protein